MNVDNDNNREPVTDLGLALGYSNQCIQRRLNSDSGAGANAGSRVDMKFVASDPLSELVWSPHKGLSLKCADSSLAEKRPSLLWGARSSNMVLSPPQSITAGRTSIYKPMDEGNMVASQESFHVKDEVGETATLVRSPRNNAGIMSICGSSQQLNTGTHGNLEEMNTVVEASALDINEKEDLNNDKRMGVCVAIHIPMAAIPETRENNFSSSPGEDQGRMADFVSFRMGEPHPDMAQIEPVGRDFNNVISSDSTIGRGDVGSGNQTQGMEVVLASEVRRTEYCKTRNPPLPNSTSACKRDEGIPSFIEEESKDIVKTPCSTSVPLDKLESTDENDLQALDIENACGAVSKIVGPESAHEVENRSRMDEDIVPGGKNVPIEHSPTKSRIHVRRRKGKEKALSDGDVDGSVSKEEDDSHESVESCNSAGLFSRRRKPWNFEQQLIKGSKRVKEQIQDSPGSKSFTRQDSSFMNWISNMTKGFSRSNQVETPSLALTLAHPNHEHESNDRKVFTCNKNQDPGSNMGFQSVFQSLYCPNTKVQETRTLDAGHQPHEGSKELELANKICAFNVTPIAFRGVNDNFCKQFLRSHEKHKQSTSGNGAGTSTHPKISFPSFAASQENKTNSVENKISYNLESGMEKGEVSPSNTSLGKRKTRCDENNDSEHPSEEKAANNFGYRSDPLGSLWITRFSPKTSHPMINIDHCMQSTGRALECSVEGMRLIPHSQNCITSSKDQKNLESREYSSEDPLNAMGRELQKCAANTEASFELTKTKGHDDQKLKYKLDPIVPSQRFKSPEAMASLFARRLDALKNIVPSYITDNAARATTTCFFCGIRGHDLRDCSEIMETELKDLLRNFNSYNGAEESPCLCIRCFQVNHWAIACPNVSSIKRHQSEYSSSMLNHCSSSKMQVNGGNGRSPKLLENKESQSEVTGTHTVCDRKIPGMDTILKLNQKWRGTLTSDKMVSNSNPVKNQIASSSGECDSKENQIIPLCNFVNQQISDVPKGIFDVIKRLRLSRTNILKWMNSRSSLSHLDGFFLRLRLGKWEEGLGGTGYYVACITGSQKEKSPQSSKNPISVNIGGIKCLVESQYISNHDFLEDELMAWWCATLKSGGKVPSEEDLRVKIEEREKLGF
ncbi:hypothetical protein L1049_016770 [Liquidambar formosana]|uniref:Plus3 domain-containing protein n=1 Tax=Liquidambar formosana TaxID=63359 RepID=A0AAP0S6Y7_LIQFO